MNEAAELICRKDKSFGGSKKEKQSISELLSLEVRMKGLEPPRREAPDPKSGAAANYATSAAFIKLDCKDIFLN